MKRLLVAIAAIAAVLLAAAYVFRAEIALRLTEPFIEEAMSAQPFAALPDGLHIWLCGAGGPMADRMRSGPCLAVYAGGTFLLIDTGAAAPRNLNFIGLPIGAVDHVLLTHYHSDHIDGLGEVMLQRWANAAAPAPLPVHGPGDVGAVVEGFNRAYDQDTSYRIAHHGAATMPPNGAGGIAMPFKVPEIGEEILVLEEGGLRVTAFQVDHGPIKPAVGYKLTYKDRSAIVSGDTAKSANLAAFSAGADLLVHEALAPQLVARLTEGAEKAGRDNIARITVDILNYHTPPVEAAEIAAEAGVKHLLFYHIIPPLPVAGLEEAFLRGVSDKYAGPVTVGRDGTYAALPAGSDAVRVTK